MNKIILIGTSHTYQKGIEEAKAIEQFINLLNALSSEHKITVIAEEMRQSDMDAVGKRYSIPCMLATELRIKHQYSDASDEVRAQIGFCPSKKTENDIRIDGIFNNWPQERIEAEIKAEMSKSLPTQKSNDAIREQYWLDQLLILNSWPLLFVCGANHTENFASLLQRKKFDVIVPFKDWKHSALF